MDDLELAKTQLEDARAGVLSVVKKIVSVLEKDIPTYVINTVREVFIQEFEHAKSMSKDDVAQLKKDAEAIAEEAKLKITKELLTTDKWFVKERVAGYRDSIYQNGEISAILKSIDNYIYDLLVKYKFPEVVKHGRRASYNVTPYDLSAFGSEEELKELSKDYWKEVAKYYELKEKVNQLEADIRKEAAKKIWDAI
ncbi:MAG: hypothetical protein ABH874_03950 [Methanobacteriota archaeon]